jgi:single-strand DNA-binding protein
MNKNRILLIGHATDDPTVYVTQAGKRVCHFSIATNQYLGQDEDGSPRQRVDFHSIRAWENQCESAIRKVQKGVLICIEGSLHYKSFEKNGVKIKSAEITAFSITRLQKYESGQNDQPDPDQHVQDMPYEDEAIVPDYAGAASEDYVI